VELLSDARNVVHMNCPGSQNINNFNEILMLQKVPLLFEASPLTSEAS